MSAKSLGMIHTVNYGVPCTTSDFPGAIVNIDIPGQLSEQLNRMVRQGNFFKCVGIDMTLDTIGTIGGGQVSGYLRYFAPTRGRCEAFRGAFDSMRQQMKMQGISMKDNLLYDFKVGFNDAAVAVGSQVSNQASLNGTDGLTFVNSDVGLSVFGTHNNSVRPTNTQSASDTFKGGFDTVLTDKSVDFIVNDVVPYTGNEHSASELWESIPFTMSWTPDSTDIATKFSWRPDPALYLAILAGQIQVYVEELNVDGTPTPAPGVNINIAVHISGWKSIMGAPTRKAKRSRKATTSKKSKK